MKIHTSIITSLLVVFFSLSALGQEVLPKGLTENEKELLTDFNFRSSRISIPPSGDVRTMAEWEEIEYLVITWAPNFQNILRQIVEAAVIECKVIITTQNETSVAPIPW